MNTMYIQRHKYLLRSLTSPENLSAEEARQKLSRPLMERLEEEAEDNPAAATVLGQERLLEWLAEPNETKLKEAWDRLSFAAEQGEPEACFTLATFEEPLLCTDSAREEYRVIAEQSGHHIAREYAKWHEQENQSAAQDDWLIDLEQRSYANTQKINAYRPTAEAGDPKAQLELGKALQERFNIAKESHAETDYDLDDEAQHWVKEAAEVLPEARHYLAMKWNHEPSVRLGLLRSATYPSEGKAYYPALLGLADEFEVLGDLTSAESSLRQAVEHDILNASYKLALLLVKHRHADADSLAEAKKLFLEVALGESFMFQPEAAFFAARMLLRGEGGEPSFDHAQEMFLESARLFANIGKNNAIYFCARLALAFAVESPWEKSIELMIRHMDSNDFSAEPELPLVWNDLMLLIKHNKINLQTSVLNCSTKAKKATEHNSDLSWQQSITKWMTRLVNLTRALFVFLKEPNLQQSDIEALLSGQQSMLEHYILGRLWQTGRLGENHSEAEEHLRKANENGVNINFIGTPLIGPLHLRSDEFKSWLFRKSLEALLRLEIEQKQKAERAIAEHKLQLDLQDEKHRVEMQRAVIEENSRMLSYLTHTLNNTFSSGPESARQAMRILGSELYENNREYKAINNIASMFSTFLFAQQLLKTFKLYIADPEALRQNWVADVDGDATIAVVLAVTLRQTLSQVVFASNHQAALQRLLPYKDTGAVKAIRRAFMDEIVPLDVDTTNTWQVFDWVKDHLGLIHVNIDPAAEFHFRSNSTRYTFFFSSFSELIYNALKYSDGNQPIEITWGKSSEKDRDVFVFSCVNTWTENSIQSSEGSGKGLVYLARLTEMLGATFEKRLDDHRFIAEIRFPVTLLGGQA